MEPDLQTEPPRRGLWGRAPRVLVSVLLLVGAAGLIVGNIRSASSDEPLVAPSRPGEARPQQPPGLVYITLGDSLGRGVQPDPARSLHGGYARPLRDAIAENHPAVKLVNAACGGATTASFIAGGKACAPDVDVPYGNDDASTSQLSWAAGELKARRALPTLLTLTVGGNDVTSCLRGDVEPMRKCLESALPELERNWETIAARLGDAAGPRTVLSVATLYDPALAALRLLDGRYAEAARVFHTFVVSKMNPQLRRTFAAHSWVIADMGAAVFEEATIGGPNSVPVRAICTLTWACARTDVHLNDAGYDVLAEVFGAELQDRVEAAVAAPAPQG